MKHILFAMACIMPFGVHTVERPDCIADGQLSYSTMTTSQGSIAYVDTGGEGFPVVLIHGNSCSSEVFKNQIRALRNRYRIVSVDLPGHGRSSLPNDPNVAYTIPGYANLLHEVVNHLGLGPFAVVGYSLGGNIALQWTEISKDPIVGIMLVSSAPMKYSEEALVAYPPYEGSLVGHPDQLTERQAKQYMGAAGFDVEDPSVYFMIEDAMKTDGKSRANMVASVVQGRGVDETKIVSRLTIPLALVAGREDASLGHNYIARLKILNLWRGKVEYLEHAKHAVPLHQSQQLNLLLEEFLADISNR